jgi:hypothetical protein
VSASGGEIALLALVRETVEDLGALVAGHVKLARAEIGRDVRAYGRRAAAMGVVIALLLVGHVFACVAGALALARVLDPPLAYLAIGALHLVAGGAVVAYLQSRRGAAPRPLDDTLSELDRTVATLTPARLTAARKGADGLA